MTQERVATDRVWADRVWADIDLDALGHNLGRIRRAAGPSVAVVLVVKADAYGHGAVAIAHHAVRCGIAALGVGTSAEALELRAAGVRARILVLGTVVDAEVRDCLRHGIEVGIHSLDRVQMLARTAAEVRARARVHLNVDTGMARLGVLPHRALPLLRAIRDAHGLALAGIMTHITSAAGTGDESTATQLALFERVVDEARAEELLHGWVHAANSATLFTGGLRPPYDAVRPGIAAYGVLPGSDATARRDALELRPVMSLASQVVFLKDVPAGSAIGYGGTWTTPRDTRLATLPVGYDDGVPLRLSNRGHVLIRGQRAPIVGRVTMDYTTVDVTDIPGTSVGDRATIVGRDGDGELTLAELAERAETIPYEVSCSIGKRVVRRFVGGETLEWTPPDARRVADVLPRLETSAPR